MTARERELFEECVRYLQVPVHTKAVLDLIARIEAILSEKAPDK